jgi:polyisoprenoid-binding protein YceI
MVFKNSLAFVVLCAATAATFESRLRGADSFKIDPANSSVTIEVGKSGPLSFVAGHSHQVVGPIDSGTVELDREDPSRSRVRLVIAASRLQVMAKGEPADDVPRIQAAMESDKVLAAAQYPQMVFQSSAVTGKEGKNAGSDLTIAGQLTIRDVTRPVTIVVHMELTGETMTATGRFSIKQTEYSIKPITVGGVVAVKDALDIRFSITARQGGSP